MNGLRTSAALLASALLLAACGGADLKADDPAGYEACQTYAKSLEIHGDPLMKMGALFDAGKQAHRASTKEIRDAAQEVGGSWIVDSEALIAACKANDVGVS